MLKRIRSVLKVRTVLGSYRVEKPQSGGAKLNTA